MRIRFVIFLLLLIPAVASAKKKSTPLPAPPHAAIDHDYFFALSVADHFLQAWQGEDHEAGLLLLTDAAKQQTSADHLEKYFTPESSPQRAYTIGHGRKLKPGRYAFPVALNQQGAKSPNPRSSQIIVVQTGKDDWAIDKLP